MSADLFSHFPLRKGRTHESCGPGATGFALALAGQGADQGSGAVMWVRPGWDGSALNPVGFGAYLDPQRLLLARPKTHAETLAVAEEALRSGAVPLVVVELNAAIDLTSGRRLQLAAEAGKSTGLCLIPEAMGSNAAETRWHCAPLFDADAGAADSTLQRWALIKNKSGTIAAWDVRWNAETRRVIVVSEAGKRQGAAGAAG
ncbi:ImuA family protein [Abyssibius alkaniclasticus]|uniref:ImuA family protein n=1 Tax=Abyssibius alkaniclasticus TaxID=2881234 RepID=UPI0040584141